MHVCACQAMSEVSEVFLKGEKGREKKRTDRAPAIREPRPGLPFFEVAFDLRVCTLLVIAAGEIKVGGI